MIKFTKKLAIVASLVTLSSGQFVAFGSNDNSNNDVDGAESYLKRLAITPAPALKTLGPIVKPNKI